MTGFKFQISLVVVVFVEVSAGSNRRVLQLREADVERWSGGGETDVNTERQRDHLYVNLGIPETRDGST